VLIVGVDIKVGLAAEMFPSFVLRALRHNFKHNKIILTEGLRLCTLDKCDKFFNEI